MSGNESGLDLSNPPPPVPMPEVDHPTDRPNFCRVRAGGITYWFSYRTCIAFSGPGCDTVVRENSWGPTTGKHLSYIDGGDKKSRLSSEAFEMALETSS
jgi:hypothetical protein